MDNFPYVINMFVHIVAIILYAGGLFYVSVLIHRRNRLSPEDIRYPYIDSFIQREPSLWLWYLVIIIATGLGFGVISIILHGKPPEIAPIAFMAFILMVIFSLVSLGMVFFLTRISGWLRAEKDIQKAGLLRTQEENIVLILLIIVIFILFCAVTLRFMA